MNRCAVLALVLALFGLALIYAAVPHRGEYSVKLPSVDLRDLLARAGFSSSNATTATTAPEVNEEPSAATVPNVKTPDLTIEFRLLDDQGQVIEAYDVEPLGVSFKGKPLSAIEVSVKPPEDWGNASHITAILELKFYDSRGTLIKDCDQSYMRASGQGICDLHKGLDKPYVKRFYVPKDLTAAKLYMRAVVYVYDENWKLISQTHTRWISIDLETLEEPPPEPSGGELYTLQIVGTALDNLNWTFKGWDGLKALGTLVANVDGSSMKIMAWYDNPNLELVYYKSPDTGTMVSLWPGQTKELSLPYTGDVHIVLSPSPVALTDPDTQGPALAVTVYDSSGAPAYAFAVCAYPR